MSPQLILSSGLFALLVVGMVVLYERRKRMERELAAFYQRRSLVKQTSIPGHLQSELEPGQAWRFTTVVRSKQGGRTFRIDWISWYVSTYINGRQGSEYRITVALPPGQPPSPLGWQSATEEAAKPAPFFGDPRKIEKAKRLEDGTYLLTWWVRNPDARVYDSIFNWLEQNI